MTGAKNLSSDGTFKKQNYHGPFIKPPYFRFPSIYSFQLETALLYDSVYQFAKAMNQLDTPRNRIQVKPLNCDGTEKWPFGYSLVNYMKVVSIFTRSPGSKCE